MAQAPDTSPILSMAHNLHQQALQDGVSIHILGDGTVITIPNPQQDMPIDTDQLKEGSEALAFFMNARCSDCLIMIGQNQIHASSGMYVCSLVLLEDSGQQCQVHQLLFTCLTALL